MGKRARIEDLENRMASVEYDISRLTEQLHRCCLTPMGTHPSGKPRRCGLQAGHEGECIEFNVRTR